MPKRKLYSISDLILFILYSSSKSGAMEFEELVKNCFKIFPDYFSLKNYPKWPDTRKLDRPLRLLRSRKLVRIDKSTGIVVITSAGKREAKEIAKTLKQGRLL